jgi:hypothetical protein
MSDVQEMSHLTHVHAARQASESLKAFAAASCKEKYLQQEACAVAGEALQVLDELHKAVSGFQQSLLVPVAYT